MADDVESLASVATFVSRGNVATFDLLGLTGAGLAGFVMDEAPLGGTGGGPEDSSPLGGTGGGADGDSPLGDAGGGDAGVV